MQITVFGATGRVGRLVVEQLLQDGHSVTAFVHQQLPTAHPSKQLKFIKSDVHNAAFVEAAVRGSDAVISTLGSWHTPTKDILSAAMRFVIPAMQQEGVRRIISLTGSGAYAPGDSLSLGDKIAHRLFAVPAGDILRDAETHLQLLADSGLEWTVLRSPVMRNQTNKDYSLTMERPKLTESVSRAAVAQALVDQLQDEHYIGFAPFIRAA